MPMTSELRRGIDRIRDYLFGGGYPNPAQNAEQLSFLIYFYMYEAADAARMRAAQRPGAAPYPSAFDGDWKLRDPRNAREPDAAAVPRELLRWSSWADALNGERLVNWVREEVFPFHAELAANGVTDFMDGARLVIDEPTVLTQVVSQLNDLHLDQVDADTKGDLFEHVLRQIRQAGELGQFRTPRHVIRALVRLVDPRIGETIYDPAAGTAGFLVGAWDHIRLANSSPAGIEEIDAEGKIVRRGLGDMLNRDAVKRLQEATFHGADVDPQMVRLATMNLTLRGLDRVRILRRDALTRSLDRADKAELGFPARGFDVIFANPPFFRPAGSGPHRRGREDRAHRADRTTVPAIHAEPSEGRRALRSRRAGGRALRLHWRAQGIAAQVRREQHGRGGAVPARRGVQPLFRRQDVRTGVPQGRRNRARHVPARRQRRLQARRQPRPAHRPERYSRSDRSVPGPGSKVGGMARARYGHGLDREMVVCRSRYYPRRRLEPQRQPTSPSEPG